MEAVTKEFEVVYAGQGKQMEVHQVSEGQAKEKKIFGGAEELKSWEWQYGQTPEFTHLIEGDISIGRIVRSP